MWLDEPKTGKRSNTLEMICVTIERESNGFDAP